MACGLLAGMTNFYRVCGRLFNEQILGRIRRTVEQSPQLSRYRLAQQVCEWLDWKRPNGAFQHMSCRVALLKLHRRGVIPLPPPRRKIGFARKSLEKVSLPQPKPLRCRVDELQKLEVVAVGGAGSELSDLWNNLVATEHYLGYRPLAGAQKRYLIGSEHGWLGALGWSAAAWRVAARDRWIGWGEAAREAHLQEVVCNSRFLILPWVEVPNLASKTLALCIRDLPKDWQATYGYAPLLLETYVEQQRFTGACYRAANWVRVGSTAGRGRQDRGHARALPIKDIYLYELQADARQRLCQPACAAEVARLPGGGQAAGRSASQATLPPRRDSDRRRLGGDAGVETPSAQMGRDDWALEEFGATDLGDERLRQRLLILAHDFFSRPQASIAQACGNRAKTKAAYRFFDHPKVNAQAILESHREATLGRCAAEAVVLAVQDTTALDYATHAATEGLGDIGNAQGKSLGVWLHSTLAVTPSGVALGLLEVQDWARDPDEFGKNERRNRLPIQEKESYCWLKSFATAAQFQRRLPRTRVVSVGDREADIYELFESAERERRGGGCGLLVRAQHDRAVKAEQGHLWAQMEQAPLGGGLEVQVPRRAGQRARRARLAVRFAEVRLRPPQLKASLGELTVWAVLAQEEDAPAEVEPIRWLLLTTLEVKDFEAAVEKLRWYLQRWNIEVFHKVLKSGCRIEARQLESVEQLRRCWMLDVVVAWRIVYLTKMGREAPELPCTVAFEDYEWKALWSFVHRSMELPAQIPALNEVMRMVAGLGGFLGRKGDGHPGVKSLWLGLQRLNDIASSWLLYVEGQPQRRTVGQITVSSNPTYG
jgi:hypothetical protein